MEDETTVRLAELLTRTARRIHRSSAAELAPHGLTHAQGRTLRIIAGADGPVRMADIAARLEVVPRSATSMVDALCAAGLVERCADATDRRSVLVRLTGDGRSLLQRMHRARHRSAEEVFAPLSDEERRQLSGLLSRLCTEEWCSQGRHR